MTSMPETQGKVVNIRERDRVDVIHRKSSNREVISKRIIINARNYEKERKEEGHRQE